MAVLILVVLGLSFGSFVNALVWRVYQHEKGQKSRRLSVLHGRSMCPNCRHELAAKDLVPVVSWLVLRGRCRYCQKPISWQYPVVEIAVAVIFVASYLFWPVDLVGTGQWLLFITWLTSSVGLLALLIYDFRWMMLPSRILYPTMVVAATGRLGYILLFSTNKTHDTGQLALSLVVASGIFWLLFTVSSGRWIGFGDVRLGLVTGTLLATPAKSLLMLFLSSLLGTLFILPSIAAGRSKMDSRIPYGPFLIAATSVIVLFGQPFIDWYKNHLL